MCEELVPDLYRLAFLPGVFQCKRCGFELVKQTLSASGGQVGTSESDRTAEECPNDGTMMVHVTYRDRLRDFEQALLNAKKTQEEAFNEGVEAAAQHCDECARLCMTIMETDASVEAQYYRWRAEDIRKLKRTVLSGVA